MESMPDASDTARIRVEYQKSVEERKKGHENLKRTTFQQPAFREEDIA
jgi:hypothetical protein